MNTCIPTIELLEIINMTSRKNCLLLISIIGENIQFGILYAESVTRASILRWHYSRVI